MITAGFRFSRRAADDLQEIAQYTLGQWGPDQAVHYIDQLEACCTRLVEQPHLGKACDSIRPGLRRIACGSHIVFYRPDDRGIFVSRILHERMLPAKHPWD